MKKEGAAADPGQIRSRTGSPIRRTERQPIERRRIDSLRHSRHRPHTRFRLARSARNRPPALSALRPRTAIHDRAGCKTQMAGRSRSERNFRAKQNKKPAINSHSFAYAVSPSAAETIVDIAATLGASRLILGAPQRNALVNLFAETSFAKCRIRCPKKSICSFMREDGRHFDLRSLRKHVERCDRIDGKFLLQFFKSRARVGGLHET